MEAHWIYLGQFPSLGPISLTGLLLQKKGALLVCISGGKVVGSPPFLVMWLQSSLAEWGLPIILPC